MLGSKAVRFPPTHTQALCWGLGKYKHKEGQVPPSKTLILAGKGGSSFAPPDPVATFSHPPLSLEGDLYRPH